MGELKEFFKSKVFFINLGIAAVVVTVFFFGSEKFLSYYTRHGQYTVLPNFTNTNIEKAESMLKELNLNPVIKDSSYDEKLPARTVINQNPYPGAHVKSGRNIFLYITSTIPPQIPVPDMADKTSFRQAKGMLEASGFKLGRVILQADQCADCVLKQLYNGKPIVPGAMLPKGSTIDLVVGKGLNGSSDDSAH
jgi:beta-lactam-binding protein with PASTA domain